MAIVVSLSGLFLMSATAVRGDGGDSAYRQIVTINNPADGTTWYTGQTYQVQWTPVAGYVPGTPYCEYLTVDLYKVGATGLQPVGEIFSMDATQSGDRSVTSFPWTVPSNLAPGEYQLNVTDKSMGNPVMCTGTSNFFLANGPGDRTPPTVSFPRNDRIRSAVETPSIFVGVSDRSSGVDMSTLSVSMYHSWVAVTTDGNGFHVDTGSLSKGKHTIQVSVADNAGNKATASWSFSLTGPALKR